MLLKLFQNPGSLAHDAAADAAKVMKAAIHDRGICRIVVATGASQFPFLEELTKASRIDWSKVEAFHLDEYVGIPITHPGSFRRMLLERLVNKTGIANYHFVEGDATDLSDAVRRVSKQLASSAIDVAFVGIGENGHIAFNDPPADFETEDPYIVVELDEACRRQQVGEGWFANLSQVPTRAISMSPQQIMKAKQIVAVVPDSRKAKAVRLCMEGDVSAMAPASILRRHPNATVYLDCDSASLLSPAVRKELEEKSEVILRA